VHSQVDPIRPAMGMKSWVGGRRVHIRNALWRPGILGVAGGRQRGRPASKCGYAQLGRPHLGYSACVVMRSRRRWLHLLFR
jgi:hypothetical protein